MTNSKRKGSSFEREIAKELSLWYSDGERDDIMWRSHSSGGRATVRSKDGKETYKQYGDLSPTHPMAEKLFDIFCFELKHGYDISILDLLDSRKANPDFKKFVYQANNQSLDSGSLFYALVFRRPRREPCIAIPSIAIATLIPYIADKGFSTPVAHISIDEDNLVTTMLLREFKSLVSREEIEKVWDIYNEEG